MGKVISAIAGMGLALLSAGAQAQETQVKVGDFMWVGSVCLGDYHHFVIEAGVKANSLAAVGEAFNEALKVDGCRILAEPTSMEVVKVFPPIFIESMMLISMEFTNGLFSVQLLPAFEV